MLSDLLGPRASKCSAEDPWHGYVVLHFRSYNPGNPIFLDLSVMGFMAKLEEFYNVDS